MKLLRICILQKEKKLRFKNVFDELIVMEKMSFFDEFSGYEVVESGERLEDVRDSNFLFMPNHQSTADVPLCMTIFAAR